MGIPLPELSNLHGEGVAFDNLSLGPHKHVIAENTTNSFHLLLNFDVNASLVRESVGAIGVQIFGGSRIQLLPPHSTKGREILKDTDTDGPLLEQLGPLSTNESTPDWCRAECHARADCGAWTLRISPDDDDYDYDDYGMRISRDRRA